MKTTESITIHVVHGLPASGKSTWVNSLIETDRNKYHKKYRVLNTDEHYKYFERFRKNQQSFDDYLKHEFDMSIGGFRENEELLVDGLFLTNKDIINIFSIVIEVYLNRTDIDKISLIVEDWNEDREQCKINDKLRYREEKAQGTIEKAPWEKINKTQVTKELSSKFSVKLELSINPHSVYTPSIAEVIVAENGYRFKDRKIYSRSWCGGGTYGSYCGESLHVSAEKPLMYFEELFDVTEAFGVELSARHYCKLMDDLVTTECRTESDYYGGSVDYYSYVCDIDELYSWLVEHKLIKED